MDNIPNFENDLLPEYLVQTGVITAEQLAFARRRYAEYLQIGRISAYIPDNQNYAILEINSRTGELINSINLPKDSKNIPKYLSVDWIPIGSSNAFLFTDASGKLKQLSEIKWETLKETPGIAVTQDRTYFFLQGKELPYHALMSSISYEAIPLKKIKSLPLDITISSDGTFIYVADRGSGKIYIIDTIKKQVVGTLILRSAGSKKTLNLACLKDNSKILVADNHSPALFVVNPRNLKIKRNPLAYGSLGNLMLSNDNTWLYILSIRRGGFCELLILDTLNFILKAAVPLKGRVFSSLDDPCDLIALSPDNNWLIIMTYVDSPALFTPLINVIDLNSYSLEDTIPLDYDNKPSVLAFGVEKVRDSRIPSMNFIDILMEMKLIDENDLAIARDAMSEDQSTTVEPIEESISRNPSREDYSFLQNDDIDPSILVTFKEEQLRKWHFIPLNNIENILKVAAVKPNDEALQNILQNKFKDSLLQFIIIEQQEFDRFIKELYPFIKQKYLDIVSRLNTPVPDDQELPVKMPQDATHTHIHQAPELIESQQEKAGEKKFTKKNRGPKNSLSL